MPLSVLAILAIAGVLTIHLLYTRRPKLWLLAIWLLPVVGSLAYAATVLLPYFRRGPSGITPPSDPRGDDLSLAERMRDWEIDVRRLGASSKADPVPGATDQRASEASNDAPAETSLGTAPDGLLPDGLLRQRLMRAEACLAQGRFIDAIDLFESARCAAGGDAPAITHNLARAYFGMGEIAETVRLLDALQAAWPDFQPDAIAILKARALAKEGSAQAALSLLDAMLLRGDGADGRRLEAQYRHAEILWQSGATQQAVAELTEITRRDASARADEERHWIRLAGQALQAIS